MAQPMPTQFPSTFATITTTDGKVSTPLLASDVLWTARAAAREAENEAEITPWVFAQRYVLFHLRSPSLSYADVLLSFSQPINPKWRADGEFCRPGGKYANTDFCSSDKLAARQWYATATWSQLDTRHPQVTKAVAAWAQALVQNPVPRVTNFSNAAVGGHYLDENPASKVYMKGANWYIVDPGPSKWPADYVQLVSGSNVAKATSFTPQAIWAAIRRGMFEWWRV
jgi:hypothetical protein